MERGIVGITVPHLNLRRTFPRKGAIQNIPFELLEQAIYEPGVEYLFRSGILTISDLDVRIRLGLEEPDATEETAKMIELTDEYAEELLFKTPLKEFREKLTKLSYEQAMSLADIAIKKELMDYQRAKLLKDITEKDIMTIVMREQEERERELAEESKE